MQEFLCRNVVFLLQTQLNAATFQPLISPITSGNIFKWNLLSEPIPPAVVLEEDELFGDAALYWHRIAISADKLLSSSNGRLEIEPLITSFSDEWTHSTALKELFQEFWSVSADDKVSPTYQWKIYCILIVASSIIERLLYEIYYDTCHGMLQVNIVSIHAPFANSHSASSQDGREPALSPPPAILRELLSTPVMIQALPPGSDRPHMTQNQHRHRFEHTNRQAPPRDNAPLLADAPSRRRGRPPSMFPPRLQDDCGCPKDQGAVRQTGIKINAARAA